MAKKQTKRKKSRRDQYKYVGLIFWGKDLDPEEVTKRLRIEPDNSWYRGFTIGKSGKKYTRPYGQWILRPQVRSNAGFEKQIADIVTQLKGRERAIRTILKQAKAELAITVEPNEEVVVWHYSFDSELLKYFVSLGVGIRFGVHSWRK